MSWIHAHQTSAATTVGRKGKKKVKKQRPPTSEQFPLNGPFTPSETRLAAFTLNRNKAGDSNGNVAEPFQLAPKNLETAEYYINIFNDIASSGNAPESWRHTFITYFWKGKGKKTECGNYRPISCNDLEYLSTLFIYLFIFIKYIYK